MFVRAISRTKFPNRASIAVQCLAKTLGGAEPLGTLASVSSAIAEPQVDSHQALSNFRCLGWRSNRDGRPRGPLWKGKKLIGKEALFVITGMKRFKADEEKLDKFVKKHVLRVLKLDKIVALNELERQEEVDLAVKMFKIIQKEDWYTPDVYLYKDLILLLAKSEKMDEVKQIWEDMRSVNLFPDSQTYSVVITGFLTQGSLADAMNVYEDMLKSPEPPEELPFTILLEGLLPHPLLRNKVKKDYEEIFPEAHIYDPTEEIFVVP